MGVAGDASANNKIETTTNRGVIIFFRRCKVELEVVKGLEWEQYSGLHGFILSELSPLNRAQFSSGV
jgi:hypothetical protein